jgi:hypothetical protein
MRACNLVAMDQIQRSPVARLTFDSFVRYEKALCEAVSRQTPLTKAGHRINAIEQGVTECVALDWHGNTSRFWRCLPGDLRQYIQSISAQSSPFF